MNFIQRGFIIRNGDLLPLKNSDDLCFALPRGGFMVDGLKLLVTDGRIILVILQEKVYQKETKNMPRWLEIKKSSSQGPWSWYRGKSWHSCKSPGGPPLFLIKYDIWLWTLCVGESSGNDMITISDVITSQFHFLPSRSPASYSPRPSPDECL